MKEKEKGRKAVYSKERMPSRFLKNPERLLNQLEHELILAAREGYLERCKDAVAKGASVNAVGLDGWTPLMEAVFSGKEDVVKALISMGACIEQKNCDGDTALIIAVWSDSEKIASILLDAGADPNAKRKSGMTALMFAAINSPKLIEPLVKKGANIDATDCMQRTALMIAAIWGNKEGCIELMRLGANPLLQDNEGRMAEDLAKDKGLQK
ncbi:MAG: ankyrin repeat domain-containing protein [Candidatus Anstonellales archaeon]